jgi:uncharacterized protein DUF1360
VPPDDTSTDVSWPAAIRLAVGILATWRIAHLLAEEDGPGDIVLRLRVRAGASWIGGLMDCFGCLSVWVAAPVAALVSPRRRDVALTWLGLSGGAYLLEQATSTGDVATVYEPLHVAEPESAAIT